MEETDDRWQRVDEVFALAVETPPEQRRAVIEKACGGDPELRREIERLLDADARAQGFLDVPAGKLWLEATGTVGADGSQEASRDALLAGHTLAGRHRILSLIGRGGMGAVYRAHDAVLGTEVAVKVLHRRSTRSPVRLEAFRREVKLARLVSHPNVCRVHDIGDDNGAVFLTMEYVAGESLGQRLRRGGHVPDVAWCLRVLRDVARGLAAAHAAGVVHRDLKPENVLLRSGRDEAVVVDFGIAAELEDDGGAGWIAGTRGHMSPEQLAGRPVDARSDVYALGILAHLMATGQLPEACRDTEVAQHSPARAPARLPPALEGFVRACLRVDPVERPENAAAALALLEGSVQPASRPRRAWRMKLAASLAVLLLLAGAGLWWRGRGESPSTGGLGTGTAERSRTTGTNGVAVALSGEVDADGRARVQLGPLEMESDRDGASKLKIRGLTLRTNRGGSSVATAAGVVVDESDVTRALTCAGDDVRVTGSGNTLRLDGECAQVTVSGDRNVLTLEAAAAITVVGRGNHIVWQAGVGAEAPRISDRGSSNSIRPAAR